MLFNFFKISIFLIIFFFLNSCTLFYSSKKNKTPSINKTELCKNFENHILNTYKEKYNFIIYSKNDSGKNYYESNLKQNKDIKVFCLNKNILFFELSKYCYDNTPFYAFITKNDELQVFNSGSINFKDDIKKYIDNKDYKQFKNKKANKIVTVKTPIVIKEDIKKKSKKIKKEKQSDFNILLLKERIKLLTLTIKNYKSLIKELNVKSSNILKKESNFSKLKITNLPRWYKNKRCNRFIKSSKDLSKNFFDKNLKLEFYKNFKFKLSNGALVKIIKPKKINWKDINQTYRKSKFIFMNFWDTSCHNCIKEMPYFKENIINIEKLGGKLLFIRHNDRNEEDAEETQNIKLYTLDTLEINNYRKGKIGHPLNIIYFPKKNEIWCKEGTVHKDELERIINIYIPNKLK